MRKWITILIFLLLLSFVNGSVLKFNDTVYDGDIVEIEDIKFMFRLSKDGTSLRTESNNQLYINTLNDCSKSTLAKICFDRIFIDNNSIEYKARTTIEFYEPNISIIRTVDKSTVDVGSDILFDVELENIGDLIAKDLEYTDSFPVEFKITSVHGKCQLGDKNSVKYTGDIEKNGRIKCSYKITPLHPTESKLEAQINYNNSYKLIRTYSDLIDITVNPSYLIETKFNDTIPEIGKEFFFYLNITNNVNENLLFQEFQLNIPLDFEIKHSNMDKALDNKINTKFNWDGKLKKNTTKEFKFTLIPKLGGNFDFIYSAIIEKDESLFESHNNKISFEVNEEKLGLTSSLDEHNKFDAGKEMVITFVSNNTNRYANVYNITMNITSSFFNMTTPTVSIIRKNTSKMIFKTLLLAPNTSQSITYKLKVILDYHTELGVKKTISDDWNVVVAPQKEITFEKKFSKTSVEEGETVDVEVSMKNNINRPIFEIDIKEIIPEGFSYYGKTKAYYDYIVQGNSTVIYSYSFTAPKIKNNTEYLFNTSITYYEDLIEGTNFDHSSISSILTKKLIVIPKKPTIKITKSLDSKNIELGEQLKINYEIENTDTETAFDLHLVFSESEWVDLIDEFDYNLERIEPSEIVSFQRELIRPKKIGKINGGKSFLTFKDSDGNKFNQTISGEILEVSNKNVFGPIIHMNKTVVRNIYDDIEIFNITITSFNIGDESTSIKINDQNKRIEYILPARKIKNYSYSFESKINKTVITPVIGFYEYKGKEYRSYGTFKTTSIKHDGAKKINSKPKEIVSEPKEEIINETIISNEVKNINDNNNEKTKNKIKSSIFNKIKNYLKKIFSVD